MKKKFIRKFLNVLFCLTFILVAGFLILANYTTSVTKNIDSYIYDLPFKKGDRYKVVQGYGGLFTHMQTAALDFEMPIGTPIYAARPGTIYSFKDQSEKGGILPKYRRMANYVIIKHDDGSFGCYWHLKKNGVLVKKGSVAKGQLIGLSGATGQVFRPHLHFSVKRQFNYQIDSYVKTKFNTMDGVTLLQNGKSYQKPGD